MKKNGFSKIKYALMLFLYFCVQILLKAPSLEKIISMQDWRTTPYLLTYELGIKSRFLVGSVISLFTDYLSRRTLYIIVLCVLIVMAAVISLFLGKMIEAAEEKNKKIVLYLTVLFLIAPSGISILFAVNNFGVFDSFLILLTLYIMAAAKRKYLCWTIPLVSVIGMAIHQVYATTYLGIAVVVLLYEWMSSRYKKSRLALCIVSFLSMGASFLYLQFFTKPLAFADEYELIAYLSPRTDIALNPDMLHFEYFHDLIYNFKNFYMFYFPDIKYPGLVGFAALSPLFVLFGYIWIKMIRSAQNKADKCIYFLCMLSPALILPSFVLAIDFDRWFGALLVSQFAVVFYLVYRKNKAMNGVLAALKNQFEKRPVLFYTLLFYCAALLFLSRYSKGYIGDMISEQLREILS